MSHRIAHSPVGGSDSLELALRAASVALALATSWIHFSLGGLLFLMNAIGYGSLAVALVLPIEPARHFRWLVRIALISFTLTTIVGWLLVGARFELAYFDKAIEVALIGTLLADAQRADGGRKEIGARVLGLARTVAGPLRRSIATEPPPTSPGTVRGDVRSETESKRVA
jgi:hypothetical protein